MSSSRCDDLAVGWWPSARPAASRISPDPETWRYGARLTRLASEPRVLKHGVDQRVVPLRREVAEGVGREAQERLVRERRMGLNCTRCNQKAPARAVFADRTRTRPLKCTTKSGAMAAQVP
jgi:hypothetical protein